MRESCITLYSTIIQALQQHFLQQIIQLHTRSPALTLNLQDPAHSPQTQQHQRQDCGPGGSAKARCFFGSQIPLHSDESMAAAPSATVSAAHACERGHCRAQLRTGCPRQVDSKMSTSHSIHRMQVRRNECKVQCLLQLTRG